MYYTRNLDSIQVSNRLKVKEWTKMYHANINYNKARVAILIEKWRTFHSSLY